MAKVEKTTYKGKTIVLVDLTNSKCEETIAFLPEAAKVIHASAPKSCLIMTDVTGAVYNKEVADAMKNFSNTNTPYVKASAVVGAQGVQYVLLQTITFITRRELKTFPDRTQAKDWLVSVP